MKAVDKLMVVVETVNRNRTPAWRSSYSSGDEGTSRRSSRGWSVAGLMLTLLMLAGCEVVIDADFPDYTPELAVYSFVSPGEPIYVAVFETQDVRASSSTLWDTVEGASVTIWQDGVLRVTAELQDPNDEFAGPQLYVADWSDLIRLDSPITLKIQAAGFPAVQSTVAIPEPALFSFQNATSVDDPDFGVGETQLVTARFRLVDQEEADNYFLLVRTVDFELSQSYFDPGFTVSDAPFRETVLDDTEDYETRVLFSDATFRGGVVNFAVKFHTDKATPGVFKLYSISKSYFEYERTRVIQQETVDNPFAEPSPIYSNVEGGQGVLGTTSVGTVAEVSVGTRRE